MAVATAGPARHPPPWRDVRVLRALAQVAVVALVVVGFAYLWNNLADNLRRLGIRTDFEFLDQPAGFRIAGSEFRPSESVTAALRNGAKNTLLAAVVGIVLTTLLGTLLGVGRLSTNWLVRKAAAVYVETLRNIPPLLVIVFMSLAVLVPLPSINRAYDFFGVLVVSNKGTGVVMPTAEPGATAFLVVMAFAAVGAGGLWTWRTRVEEATGTPHHRVLWSGGLLLVVGFVAFVVLGGPLGLSRPEVEGRQVAGGITMLSGYLAVTAGLTLYTASHVAEIVRGSILSVPKGQSEAAQALALSEFQRLRFVILPQAFRVAIPPLINQYLNLTKNTSLGVAVGYAELTSIAFITIGNGKPAPQVVLLLMGAYLVFSLVISAATNAVNRRLRLSERG